MIGHGEFVALQARLRSIANATPPERSSGSITATPKAGEGARSYALMLLRFAEPLNPPRSLTTSDQVLDECLTGADKHSTDCCSHTKRKSVASIEAALLNVMTSCWEPLLKFTCQWVASMLVNVAPGP